YHVHVDRRDRGWPAQSALVVGLLGDRRDDPGQSDAVRAHRDADRLAVRAQRVEPERVGEPATELEHVPDLDAAPGLESPRPAGRTRVAGPHGGRLDR